MNGVNECCECGNYAHDSKTDLATISTISDYIQVQFKKEIRLYTVYLNLYPYSAGEAHAT